MTSELSARLTSFFQSSQKPVIFLGAGASARAGLPTWASLISQLAESIRSTDPLVAQIMRERVAEGDLTGAFDFYLLSNKTLEGDKAKTIRRLLNDYDASAIEDLAALPFKSCITTNFDRSFHDAFAMARKSAAIDFKLGDPSFREAAWETGPYVARIHGAVEHYKSLILAESQFHKLLNNDQYLDLLGEVFLRRNVLFIGFSFYDPAIKHVLTQLHQRYGSSADGRHLAVIPDNMSSEFLTRANRLNIEVITYSPDNNHEELWSAISRIRATPDAPRADTGPFNATKKFLAACIARARTAEGDLALKDAILEGVVSAIIQSAAPNAISHPDILEHIRLSLGLKESDSRPMVDRALSALADSDLILRQKGSTRTKFQWKGDIFADDSLQSSISSLTQSVVDRAKLQEKWEIGPDVKPRIDAFFQHLVERRGWDLGAAFAAGRPPDNVDMAATFEDCGFPMAAYDKERLTRVLSAVVERPTLEEAKVLSELGRMSFALEMAFRSPRSVLLRQAILPRRIYFDASVLLPAIVPGHPFQQTYIDAIERLKRASAAAASGLELSVCSVYLNEIITHKRNAEAMAREAGEEFVRMAHSDALYRGSANSNVFVGAFANMRLSHKNIEFCDFLAEHAPYKTEAQLETWLGKKGLRVVKGAKIGRYAAIYSALETSNANSLTRGKNPILIEHDAVQLAILDKEVAAKYRTIFITADRQLRDAASAANIPFASEAIMSHVGLVQFIDLMLGGVNEGVGLTQMLWSSRVSAQSTAVRSYFVSRALEEYDAGIAMAMPDLIDQHAFVADRELKRLGVNLESENPAQRVAALRVLGSLEANYFRAMNEAVERIDRGD